MSTIKTGINGRRPPKIRQCSTCGRTFAKTDHLERHVRSHTKEKPFVCVMCGRRYGRHDTLLRHLKDHPEDPQQSNNSFDGNESQGLVVDNLVNSSSSLPIGNQATLPLTGIHQHAFTPDQLSYDMDISLEAFNFDLESQFPAWLDDSDLQNGLFDTPLATTMAELRPGWAESPLASRAGPPGYKPVSEMKKIWFTATAIEEDHDPIGASGPGTPLGSRDEVDDSYRQTLTQSLQIRPMKEQTSLPSADFLNLCVRSYFARFHPIFPVVHAPTFRPSKANSMLLLSICSVGSLFTGSVHAVRQGIQIYDRLHKAVLANWDRLVVRGPDQRTALVQTAIIGQTFGLLSGEPRHLAVVDTFNGTLISWARRSHTFKTKKMLGLDLNLGPTELDKKWREWARNEEQLRIALSVHVHDAELAAMFHHEPFLRHNSRQLPVAASSQAFMATRADEWRKAYLSDPSNLEMMDATPASVDAYLDFDLSAVPQNSNFTAYVMLEGICANIVENRLTGYSYSTESETKDVLETLTSFHHHFLQDSATWEADHMDMSILWHLAFMTMFADFDLLERAIGRDGVDISAEDLHAVTFWANSDMARRCVIHGLIIHKKLESLPLGFEPAIHVPRAMFRAGVAWFCYSRFGSRQNDVHQPAIGNPEYPELHAINANSSLLLFQASGYKHVKPTMTEINASLSGLTDLLRRVGHWEIARRFAAILGALLHDEAA